MAERKNPRVMVCVTQQRSCQRLIKHGARLAKDQEMELSVVHVVKPDGSVLGGENDGEALDYLFAIAKEYDADMVMLRSDNLIESLVRFARDNRAEIITLGRSRKGKMAMRDVVRDLEQALPNAQIIALE